MSLLTLDPNFKPAFDGQQLAQELIFKIIENLPITQAYLFGSASIGKNTINSDLDILLVIPNQVEKKQYYNIVAAPHFSPVAVDWIIKNEDEFNQSKELGGISMIAAETGVELRINDSI